ncbi:unnamed protein product [Ixodes pacificus]
MIDRRKEEHKNKLESVRQRAKESFVDGEEGEERSGRVEKSKKCGASVVSPAASTGASAALRPFLGPLSRFRLWGGRGWVDEPGKEGKETASAINVRRRAARRRGTLRRARVCERAGWGGVEGGEGEMAACSDPGLIDHWPLRTFDRPWSPHSPRGYTLAASTVDEAGDDDETTTAN